MRTTMIILGLLVALLTAGCREPGSLLTESLAGAEEADPVEQGAIPAAGTMDPDPYVGIAGADGWEPGAAGAGGSMAPDAGLDPYDPEPVADGGTPEPVDGGKDPEPECDDTDGDGQCDADDPCPFDTGDDTDGDGVCDSDDPCPLDSPDDIDGDGVCTSDDLCPADSSKAAPGQCGCGVPEGDSDGDGQCDAVDPCPSDRYDDSDGDGSCDGVDTCPGFDDRLDGDSDGVPDGCDVCMYSDDDLDGNGYADACDQLLWVARRDATQAASIETATADIYFANYVVPGSVPLSLSVPITLGPSTDASTPITEGVAALLRLRDTKLDARWYAGAGYYLPTDIDQRIPFNQETTRVVRFRAHGSVQASGVTAIAWELRGYDCGVPCD